MHEAIIFLTMYTTMLLYLSTKLIFGKNQEIVVKYVKIQD